MFGGFYLCVLKFHSNYLNLIVAFKRLKPQNVDLYFTILSRIGRFFPYSTMLLIFNLTSQNPPGSRRESTCLHKENHRNRGNVMVRRVILLGLWSDHLTSLFLKRHCWNNSLKCLPSMKEITVKLNLTLNYSENNIQLLFTLTIL